MVEMMEDIANTESHETSAMADVSSPMEGPDMSQQEGADMAQPDSGEREQIENASITSPAPSEEKEARPKDPWEPLRAKMRSKESVDARVVKWQRNGLEVEI